MTFSIFFKTTETKTASENNKILQINQQQDIEIQHIKSLTIN